MRMETAARIGDNRKFAFFTKQLYFEKSKMVQDINGASFKVIPRLVRWEEFFEAKLNYDMPSVILDIADSLVESYVYNCKPPTKEEIICYPET